MKRHPRSRRASDVWDCIFGYHRTTRVATRVRLRHPKLFETSDVDRDFSGAHVTTSGARADDFRNNLWNDIRSLEELRMSGIEERLHFLLSSSNRVATRVRLRHPKLFETSDVDRDFSGAHVTTSGARADDFRNNLWNDIRSLEELRMSGIEERLHFLLSSSNRVATRVRLRHPKVFETPDVERNSSGAHVTTSGTRADDFRNNLWNDIRSLEELRMSGIEERLHFLLSSSNRVATRVRLRHPKVFETSDVVRAQPSIPCTPKTLKHYNGAENKMLSLDF